MKAHNILMFLGLGLSLISCGNDKNFSATDFSLQVNTEGDNIQKGKALQVSIQPSSEINIDSVTYSYAGKTIGTTNQQKALNLSLTKPLGKNLLEATVYTHGENINLKKEIVLHNDKAPTLYTYTVVNTYPHDATAFTQGLEFYKDTLYEGTGRRGESSIRKVNLETGELYQKKEIDFQYFGEGISLINDKLYQLTWRNQKGFIYDANSLEQLESFSYTDSQEGWGLCNDGEYFYKSDGTEKIWLLNIETLAEERYIQTVTHKSLSTKLNELEWVEGKIYANTWQRDGIAIINPENGAIEGLIDMRGLRDRLDNKDQLSDVDDVLNGIAYHKETQKLYVTGKHWDKLFEITIEEK